MTDEEELNVIVGVVAFLLIYLPVLTLCAERAWKGQWERNRHVESGNIWNCLWIITGGLVVYVCWFISGVIWNMTNRQNVANQCFEISKYAFQPFNKQLYLTRNWLFTANYSERIENLWRLIFGVPLALCHCIFATIPTLTIIGLPLACAHLKLANRALKPFGLEVLRPVSIRREGCDFLLYVGEAFFPESSALIEVPEGESIFCPNVNICCEYRDGEVCLLK